MANTKIPNVNLSTSVNTWRTRFNQLIDSVGEVNSMTTTAGPVADAINELDSDLFGSGGGRAKTGLATTAKNIQDAINELDSDIGARPHTTLATTAKTLTAAVNELDSDIGARPHTTLATTAKTLTAAVNELDSDIGARPHTTLATTAKTLTAAVNELDSDIGARPHTTLNTAAKTLTGAVNEIHGRVGNTTLTTVASTTTAAINELETNSNNLDSNVGTRTSLATNTRADLVSAINEIHGRVGTTTLETTATTTTAAINELNTAVSLLGDSAGGNVGTLFTQLGDITSLTTTDKSSVVAAINEVNATPGLSSVAYRDSADSAEVLVITAGSTVFKQTIHLNAKVGFLSNLNTTVDSSVVGAINELHRRLPDIYNSSGTLLNT